VERILGFLRRQMNLLKRKLKKPAVQDKGRGKREHRRPSVGGLKAKREGKGTSGVKAGAGATSRGGPFGEEAGKKPWIKYIRNESKGSIALVSNPLAKKRGEGSW